jgi:hypothetical protein
LQPRPYLETMETTRTNCCQPLTGAFTSFVYSGWL